MNFRTSILVQSVALIALAGACTGSDFSGSNAKKDSADSKVATVEVPLGGEKDIPHDGVKSCESADPDIVSVDPKTCKATGNQPGKTDIKQTLADGSQKIVHVVVPAKDGETSVSVPVGGTKPVPGIDAASIKSCSGSDDALATVDAKTCKVTGVKVGTMTVKAELKDGTEKTITVDVTPNEQKIKVGDKESIPGLNDNSTKSCESADPTVAKVDPKTCEITGLKPGTTQLIATLNDGTKTSTDIAVGTDTGSGSNKTSGSPPPGDENPDASSGTASAEDPGSLDTSDGLKTITGRVCLGGPACNVSYVTKSEADATSCMQTANAQTCDNDDHCGPASRLQVCNCECSSDTALPFIEPGACRRTNPLQPGALTRITECHKI